jgi:hypothetical protein
MLTRGLLLVFAAIAVSGCLHDEADDRPTHSVQAVYESMAQRGLPLRPMSMAHELGRAFGVPERARRVAGEHISGYVIADLNPLSATKPTFTIFVTVFDSPSAADDALNAEPEWVRRGPRTAQFQKDNVVATYGGQRTTEGLADLQAALDALPGEASTRLATASRSLAFG